MTSSKLPLKPTRRRADETARRGEPSRRGDRLYHRLGCLLAGSLVVLLLLATIFAFVAYPIAYGNRIFPGVSVLGVDLGGLSSEQAAGALSQQVTLYQERTLTLWDGDRTWVASPYDVGVELDHHATVEAALRVGREGGPLSNLIERWQTLLSSREVGPVVSFRADRCWAYFQWLASQIDQPVVDASVSLEGIEVVSREAQIGRRLDVAAMVDLVEAQAMYLSGGSVNLLVEETAPKVVGARDAAEVMGRMVAAPLELVFKDYEAEPGGIGEPGHREDRKWILEPTDIAAMIVVYESTGRLRPALDEAQVQAYVQGLAEQIDQPARNARFDYDEESDTLTVTHPSQEGYGLDVEATTAWIRKGVLNDPGNRTLVLPVDAQRPQVAGEDGSQLITTLAGQGASVFKGSEPGRVTNIKVASAQFHGVVVPPHEMFSFNEHLGEVTPEKGYEDAWVIFGDRSVLGPGGGVCQVSTTVFRAAFWGGYPIVERWAHTYRVGWYEPPVGLDATIYSPDVDFRFENDADFPILIQMHVDEEAGTLTVDFLGARLDRTVEIEGPYIENVIAPGPTIYLDDPSLPVGTTKQVDWSHEGGDVTIYRIIKRGDTVIAREAIFSRFQPWQARFLVGTGPPEPGG